MTTSTRGPARPTPTSRSSIGTRRATGRPRRPGRPVPRPGARRAERLGRCSRERSAPPDFLASRDPGSRAGGERRRSPGRRIGRHRRRCRATRPRHRRRHRMSSRASSGPQARRAPAAERSEPISRPPSGAYPTTTASGRRPTVSSTRSRVAAARRPVVGERQTLRGLPDDQDPSGLARHPADRGLGRCPGRRGARPLLPPGAAGRRRRALARARRPAGRRPWRPPHPPRRRSPNRRPRPTRSSPATRSRRSPRSSALTVDQLLAANAETIKNPDKIKVGQEIIIPVPTARRGHRPVGRGPRGDARAVGAPPYRGAMLIAVILPASTRNVASMCWVGAPGRTTSRSAS